MFSFCNTIKDQTTIQLVQKLITQKNQKLITQKNTKNLQVPVMQTQLKGYLRQPFLAHTRRILGQS